MRTRWPHTPIRGYEVDDAVREVIRRAGYGDFFIHRTGHSIGTKDHGQGANMDNLETHDSRRLLAMTGFSIEPGIYLPGEFGVRTEVNIALTADGRRGHRRRPATRAAPPAGLSRAALPMAGRGPTTELPTLLASTPWDTATALGRWLAPSSPADELTLARDAAASARLDLGDFHPALALLTAHERQRAVLLLAWTRALFAAAAEPAAPGERVARLHRATFHLARALAGEPSESAFLRLFAAESGRRSFGRAALEDLLAAARAGRRAAAAGDRGGGG